MSECKLILALSTNNCPMRFVMFVRVSLIFPSMAMRSGMALVSLIVTSTVRSNTPSLTL